MKYFPRPFQFPFHTAGLALLFIALSALLVRADSELDAANRAYQYGRYDEAAGLFQKLIDKHGYSASLCFDLANAEARAGHPGSAMLNYERARYLAPTDKEIDHNLQIERKKAGLPPNSYRWWEIVLRNIDWTVWMTFIGVGFVLIFLVIIGLSYLSPLSTHLKIAPGALCTIFRAVLFVGIPLCLLLGFVELATIGFNQRIDGVVVVPKGATLWISPIDNSDSSGMIPEGELVTVEDRHNDYFWVASRDKHFGWVRQQEIAPVIAGSFDENQPGRL